MPVTEPTTEQTEAEVIDAEQARTGELVVDEVLVEEISIDGMCGVY